MAIDASKAKTIHLIMRDRMYNSNYSTNNVQYPGTLSDMLTTKEVNLWTKHLSEIGSLNFG